MEKRILKIAAIFLTTVSLLSILLYGCQKDDLPVFQHWGDGINMVSEAGLTDFWDMTKPLNSSNVTIAESYYNHDSIWIGFVVDGEELISHGFGALFYYNGEMIAPGSRGSNHQADTKNWIQEAVRSPAHSAAIDELPDEFILEFVVYDSLFQDQTVSFSIPMKRKDTLVVRP